VSNLDLRGLGVLLGLVILAVIFLFIRYQRSQGLGDGTAEPFWRGGVSFLMDDLRSQQFTGVRRKRLHFPTIGMPSRGYGRLEVTKAGLYWRAGYLWSLGQNCARGSFQLPWAQIAGVTFSDKPGTISAMGGYMLIERQQDNRLNGEYLGDPSTVRKAFDTGRRLAESDDLSN
jgi:hypothetical protein